MNHTVSITNTAIEIDGKPVQIISGAIHYFRVHPEQWRDRLAKAVQMGLNCIETYFCWNLHEPAPGKYDFSGILDFKRFITIAHELGLYVIVRPGPYICAEWENGGIPPWVMALPGCRLRRNNPVYMKAVTSWFDVLLPMLSLLQYTCGGPVIIAAVENEYGSYGRDSDYLRALRDMFLNHDFDVPLITADGGGDNSFVLGGSIDECPVTLTFDCGNVLKYFDDKRQLRPDGPDCCMEYWVGAFDHWGRAHSTIETVNAADKLDEMLAAGASVNLYMFHGGTNFGFTNGANKDTEPFGDYAAHVTSYDYDAPLNECGDPTEKYFAFQQVIKKYRPDAAFGEPQPGRKSAYGMVELTESAELFGQLSFLSEPQYTNDTETMESFGLNQGFMLYETTLRGPIDPPEMLRIYGLRDRAQIWLDGKYIGAMFRTENEPTFPITFSEKTARLQVLVENTGHINYGPHFGYDLKGILQGITIRYQYQDNYTCYPLPLDDLSSLKFTSEVKNTENKPTFYRGNFDVNVPADTFVKFPGVKGMVWINGFNLGRYWNIGPGNTLYVPAPVLRQGRNEIIVFELHKLKRLAVELSDRHELSC